MEVKGNSSLCPTSVRAHLCKPVTLCASTCDRGCDPTPPPPSLALGWSGCWAACAGPQNMYSVTNSTHTGAPRPGDGMQLWEARLAAQALCTHPSTDCLSRSSAQSYPHPAELLPGP